MKKQDNRGDMRESTRRRSFSRLVVFTPQDHFFERNDFYIMVIGAVCTRYFFEAIAALGVTFSKNKVLRYGLGECVYQIFWPLSFFVWTRVRHTQKHR